MLPRGSHSDDRHTAMRVQAFRLKQQGLSSKEIAASIGCSVFMVSNYIQRGKAEADSGELVDLSARARFALMRLGISTRGAAIERMYDIRRAKNVGVKTFEEIKRWVRGHVR